jgi:hypothetical protein
MASKIVDFNGGDFIGSGRWVVALPSPLHLVCNQMGGDSEVYGTVMVGIFAAIFEHPLKLVALLDQ